MDEFIGCTLNVTKSPGLAQVPLVGTVVDETRNMLVLEVPGHPGLVHVPKQGLEGFLGDASGQTAFIGDAVRVRPEDRIKRFATRRANR